MKTKKNEDLAVVEVKGKVFETMDYDIFKDVKGNRVVNENWVEKLSEKMLDRSIDDPIRVTSTYKVLDGQHRILACKKLGKPVRFYIVDNGKDLDVANLNSDRKSWKSVDYLNFWHDRQHDNLKDYQLLKHLANNFGLGVELAVMVGARRVARDANLLDDFKAGKYKLTDYKFAQTFGEDYQKLVELLGKPAKSRTFLNVFLIFYKHPEFEFARFYHACKNNGGKLLNASDRTTMIKVFDHIYNFQLKNKKHNKVKFIRWIEDREYVEVTEKELERRAAGYNQYNRKKG